MCKLIVAVNTTDENKKFNELIQMQYESISSEPHGLGALIIDKSKNLYVFRALEKEKYGEVFDKVDSMLSTARFVSIHSRRATSGAISTENIHFFKSGDNYFAHNGFVMKYHNAMEYSQPLGFTRAVDFEPEWQTEEQLTDKILSCKGCTSSKRGYCKKHEKEEKELALRHGELFTSNYDDDERDIPPMTREIPALPRHIVRRDGPQEPKKSTKLISSKSDSLQFLESLKGTMNPKTLEEQANDAHFSGMGILVNERSSEAHIIAKKACDMLTDSKTFMAITSYKPELELVYQQEGEAFGVKYAKGDKKVTLGIKPKKVIEGVYKVYPR